MTDITLPRATVEQAVEALEDAKALLNNKDRTTTMWFADEITALRTALAQQAEPTGKKSLQVESVVAENATTQQQIEQTPPSEYRRGYWAGFAIGKREGRIEAEDALAQQAEPVEPITRLFGTLPVHDAQQAEPVEPVAVFDERMGGPVLLPGAPMLKDAQPLYTAPPQRLPLTKEEFERICASLGFAQLSPAEVARAVERAHGITDPQVEDRLARHGIPMPGDPK